jgi:hypothetical protein
LVEEIIFSFLFPNALPEGSITSAISFSVLMTIEGKTSLWKILQQGPVKMEEISGSPIIDG